LPDSLNSPEPLFPESDETIVFRTYEKVLKIDPVLSACVERWSTWRDEPIDLLDGDQITAAYCPMLRLSPWPADSERYTEVQHRAPLVIRQQLFVTGTNADVIMNFSAAVRYALFPHRDHPRKLRVQEMFSQINWKIPVVRMGAFGAWSNREGMPIMGAEGTVEFAMLVFT
jgi:hypothetical protein